MRPSATFDPAPELSPATACRGCGATALAPVLSLGRLPLANSLLHPDQLERPEPRFPLDVVFCAACALVQLRHSVPPELMFREYTYFSSYSDTFVEHARRLVDGLVVERGLNAASLALEVASNDGCLLQHYRRHGVPVLGIEPARNVAALARERGVPTLDEFFGTDLAERLRADGRRADVAHAHNVLAHVPDLSGFARGLGRVLRDDGVAVIEVPYVRELVERCEFDTIYHEHLCYFSLTALSGVLARQGLAVTHVERVAVHGGSLRVFARPAAGASPRASVAELLRDERTLGLDRIDFYRGFAARVPRLLAELRARLLELKASGRRLAAYGAAAKGTILLNCLDLPTGTLAFVADRSPHKQGLYVPGARVPVRAPQALLDEQPDDVLLLAWNLEAEILAQQAEYRRRGGRFIVPVPDVRVV